GQIKIEGDIKLPHSAEDRKLQQQTVMKLYRLQERLAFVAESVRTARDQAKERMDKLNGNESKTKEKTKKPKEDLSKILETFSNKLDSLYKTLVATRESTAITGEEQLREKVVELYSQVSNYGGKPTESQLSRIGVLEREIEKANQSFESILGTELTDINAKLSGKQVDPIKPLTKEEFDKKQAEN
ncbi:MAG: hypothetical protein AB1489_36455, partial [Acidobacteriota bacterium]